MSKTRVVVCSKPDPASVSIAEYMREQFSFKDSDLISGALEYENFLLLDIDKRHLDCNTLENDLKSSGVEPTDVIFLSKHSSSAGIKSLTVHPTGNFGNAELGGEDGKLSMSDPAFMTSSLRVLAGEPSDSFNITFEATHHGPLIGIPSYFIEIGTTEKEWKDPEALYRISHAVIESKINSYDSFVGVGGGHYGSKITQYALNNKCNIGHIISKHSHNYLTLQMLLQSVEKTPECKGFVMDNKGTRGPVRQMVKQAVDERNMELIVL